MTISTESEAARRAASLPLTWSLDPTVRHLNHGSFGAVPDAVLAEQAELRRLSDANPVRWFASLADQVGEARRDMVGLLGLDPERSAFVLNPSAGCSAVFDSLVGAQPVDVLVTNHGYGAVTMGARRLAERTGGTCTVTEIPLDAAADEVIALITADLDRCRPKLMVIDQITSSTARSFPTDELCRLARERGTLSLVDGAHAPGVLADPVCREADYWVGSLHKFACSGRSAAILVTHGDGQELFPPIDSWGAPLPFPQRFDHSGTLDLTAWLTAPFAWRHLAAAVGWDVLRAESRALLDDACDVLAEALDGVVADPIPDVGAPVGPMRLVRLPAGLITDHDSADALRVPFGDQTGIACAFTDFQGSGYLRISAHHYNTIEDYQYLAAVGIPLLRRWSAQQ